MMTEFTLLQTIELVVGCVALGLLLLQGVVAVLAYGISPFIGGLESIPHRFWIYWRWCSKSILYLLIAVCALVFIQEVRFPAIGAMIEP